MCVHEWENLRYPLSLPSKQTLMSNPPMSHHSTTETASRAQPSSSLGPRLPPMVRACHGQDKTVTQTQRKHLPIIFRSTNHPKMDHSFQIDTKTPTAPSPNRPSSKPSQLQPPRQVLNPCKGTASTLDQHSNTFYKGSHSKLSKSKADGQAMPS